MSVEQHEHDGAAGCSSMLLFVLLGVVIWIWYANDELPPQLSDRVEVIETAIATPGASP